MIRKPNTCPVFYHNDKQKHRWEESNIVGRKGHKNNSGAALNYAGPSTCIYFGNRERNLLSLPPAADRCLLRSCIVNHETILLFILGSSLLLFVRLLCISTYT